MNKHTYFNIVIIVFLLAVTPSLKAQLASEKVPAMATQLKRSRSSGVAVNHNVLTPYNSNQLSSNRITSNYAANKIPVGLRSRGILQSRSHSQGSAAVLPSNSRTLAQRGFPKRPPALPVVF